MNAKYTIDTNVLIYAFASQDNDKKAIAKELLTRCEQISLQAINEMIYVLIRKFHLPLEEIDQIVSFIKSNFIINNITIPVLEKGLQILKEHQFSFWDSMMLASALIHDCDIIYSEDMHHSQVLETRLKIQNPFQ